MQNVCIAVIAIVVAVSWRPAHSNIKIFVIIITELSVTHYYVAAYAGGIFTFRLHHFLRRLVFGGLPFMKRYAVHLIHKRHHWICRTVMKSMFGPLCR